MKKKILFIPMLMVVLICLLASCGHEHVYGEWETTKAPSCTQSGSQKRTCSCGEIETKTMDKKGHNYVYGICSSCGAKTEAKWISNRSVDYDTNNKNHYFLFSLKDKDENYIKFGATVKIRIVNDLDVEVYNNTVQVKRSDYSTWKSLGNSYIAACVRIYDNQIQEGATDKGTFYYQVTAEDGSKFSEYSLDIDNLPVKQTTITFTELPIVITTFTSTGSTQTKVKITDINYNVYSTYIKLKFTGEKLYDINGDSYSRSSYVGYKVYDSEGYIIETGTFYTDKLKVGDKFKDDEKNIYFDVIPGETYTIELLNVG